MTAPPASTECSTRRSAERPDGGVARHPGDPTGAGTVNGMAEASSPDVGYTELLPLGPDPTEYRLLTTEGVDTFDTPAGTFLQVAPRRSPG